MKTPRDASDPFVNDPFVEALRHDFPSERDEARVRRRLVAAGVVLTSAAVTSGAAATLSTAVSVLEGAVPAGLVKVSLVSKLLALPLGTKLGVATTLALVVATSVPLALQVTTPAPDAMRDESARLVARRAGSTRPTAQAPAVVQTQPAVRGLAIPAAPPPASVAASGKVAALAAVPVKAARAAPEETASPVTHKQEAPPDARVSGTGAAKTAQTRIATSSAPAVLDSPRNVDGVALAPGSMSAGSMSAGPDSRGSVSPVQVDTSGPSAASTLREETRLIERALAALGEHDAESARYWLAEHARRFPDGILVRERQRALERWASSGAEP